MKYCKWLRQFDGHFSISCCNKTGQRANGNFHTDEKVKNTTWNFKYCPYCGNKIKIASDSIQQPLSGSPEGSPKSASQTSDNGKRWAKPVTRPFYKGATNET